MCGGSERVGKRIPSLAAPLLGFFLLLLELVLNQLEVLDEIAGGAAGNVELLADTLFLEVEGPKSATGQVGRLRPYIWMDVGVEKDSCRFPLTTHGLFYSQAMAHLSIYFFLFTFPILEYICEHFRPKSEQFHKTLFNAL